MRRDLFDRVTGENFVNLTHVNAKREELEWDDKDLEQVLCSRVRRGLGQEVQDVVGDSNGAILHFLFPEKVEPREKQSKSWKWVNDRTRDGVSGSPRNLIDYVELAKKEKLKVLERDSEDCDYPSWNIDVPLLSGDIMKTALRKLSDMRVKDTLLAESGSFRSDIEKFRQGKTEHDLNSLSEIFGDRRIEVRDYLVSIGFFERYGDSYKVMFLYRDGLSMTQGKDPRMASS